jgi:hypothetical protein
MKVLIVGLPRSGTTYVQQLFRYYMKVDRHNLINEPFRSNVGTAYPVTTKKTPEEWLQSVEHVKQNGVIVKDHVHHYEMFEKETGQPFPYEIYDDFYKIKLLRSNFKSGVMSLVVSRKWGKYNDFKGDTILNEKLHIDRELLTDAYNSQLKNYKQMKAFNKFQFNETVDYEDLTGELDQDKEKFDFFRKTYYSGSGDKKDIEIQKRKPYTWTIENLSEVEDWYEDLSSDRVYRR